MIQLPLTFEQAVSLESFVSLHMYNCQAELSGFDEVPEDWSAYEAFCGCDTCETREQLMATFDWLRSNNIIDIYVSYDDPNPLKLF